MKKSVAIGLMFIALAGLVHTAPGQGDDFGAVVKLIEQFYQVKHKGIPFLARQEDKRGDGCNSAMRHPVAQRERNRVRKFAVGKGGLPPLAEWHSI